jgi:hemolysin activation/secretion protein
VLAILVAADANAGLTTVPDAVRPGAIRPGDDPVARPTPPAAATFEVPPVINRPLDVDEGERIEVAAFALKGFTDRPELGINRADVEALLEESRLARPDGFTVGHLQEVAVAVTRYYREKGLILAQAFVPVQTVDDGQVDIEIMEGRLGQVLTEGNEYFSSRLLTSPFEQVLDEPVTKERMEEILLRLSDYDGLSMFGVFQPGQSVGSADLLLRVQEERKFEAIARYDNHGLFETGRRRLRLDGFFNNITRAGDTLSVTAQHSDMPDNLFFWRGAYERPVLGPENFIGASYDLNQFRVGGQFADQLITSDTKSANLWWDRSLIRSRQKNLSARLNLARKRARTRIRGRERSIDNLTVLSLETTFDNVDVRWAGLNAAQLQISRGFNDFLGAMGDRFAADDASVQPSRLGGNGEFAEGEFTKVWLSMSRLQSLAPISEKLRHHSLLVRIEAQWSPDLLVPLEQYAIGGPNNVRAFQPTEALFDRAAFGSIEWIINAPGIADLPSQFGNRTWGELIQVSLFYDYAVGLNNSPIDNVEKHSEIFDGAGFSISFTNPNTFSTKFSFGFPLGDPRPQNGRDPQYWIDFNYFY